MSLSSEVCNAVAAEHFQDRSAGKSQIDHFFQGNASSILPLVQEWERVLRVREEKPSPDIGELEDELMAYFQSVLRK